MWWWSPIERRRRHEARVIGADAHPDHATVERVLGCRVCAAVFWTRIEQLQALDRGGAAQ